MLSGTSQTYTCTKNPTRDGNLKQKYSIHWELFDHSLKGKRLLLLRNPFNWCLFVVLAGQALLASLTLTARHWHGVTGQWTKSVSLFFSSFTLAGKNSFKITAGQGEIYCSAYTYMQYSHCVIAVSETTVPDASASPAATPTGPRLGCQCECECEYIC